jgi:hypothetical protein
MRILIISLSETDNLEFMNFNWRNNPQQNFDIQPYEPDYSLCSSQHFISIQSDIAIATYIKDMLLGLRLLMVSMHAKEHQSYCSWLTKRKDRPTRVRYGRVKDDQN